MVYFRIPLVCAVECQCFDKWHDVQYKYTVHRHGPSGPDIPCTEYWDEEPRTFAPAPKVSPWAPIFVDGRTVADGEAQLRAVQRKERARLRRTEARRANKIARPLEIEVVLPTPSYVSQEEWDYHFHSKRVEFEDRWVKPNTIKICGIDCPKIRGNWRLYARHADENVHDWKRRVKSMAAAVFDGKANKYEETWLSWSVGQQLEFLSKQCRKKNPYACLALTPPKERESDFVWTKPIFVPKGFVPKVKNLGPARYADQRLFMKMRYARLNDDRLELVARQRFRRRAVVLSDPKTHVVCSLRAALARKVEEYVKENKHSLFQEPQPSGEMDDSKSMSGVDPEPKSDQKSNVVLEDKESASIAASVPPTSSKNEYACLVAPKKSTSVDDYVDRWITVKRGTWDNQNFGAELFRLVLPQELIKNKAFRNSPNYMPWRNHTYWRGQMKCKILINANARQHGQLQVSFYPAHYMDQCFESLRCNVFTASQLSHVLITAAFSNTGELSIPFQWYNPTMCVSRGPKTWDEDVMHEEDDNFAAMGILVGRVLSKLTAGDNTPLVCHYSVLVAMEDSQFSGMIDASIVEAEMFNMASLFALQAALSLRDDNRDNPTISGVGMPVIPVNSGSWCIGNGLPEWTNVLRLNPNSSLPYAEGRIPDLDEMKIDFVKKVYGLFKTIHWDAQRNSGTLLYSMDAAPLFTMDKYPAVPVTLEGRTYQSYCIPPVGVLSSMFSWWRGSLKLRIDVVGAIELTGRLLVAYVPRHYTDITLEQAINCPHSVFDLQTTNRQFNFNIPFISDRLFWNRARVMTDEYVSYPPPGMIYFFVYNPLIANSSIPSDCNLLLYLAGGDDFEVSVPAFPILGTAFYPDIAIDDTADHQLIPKSGYFPVYAGTWRYFTFMSVYPPILRYGEITDHIAQFEPQGSLSNVLYVPLKVKNITTAESNENVFTFKADGYSLVGQGPLQPFSFEFECIATHYVAFLDSYGYCYVAALPEAFNAFSYAAISKKIEEIICVPARKIAHNFRINKEAIVNLITQYLEWFFYNMKDDPHFRMDYGACTSIDIQDGIVSKEGKFYKPDNFILIPASITGEAGDQRTEAATSLSSPQATACGRSVGAITAYGENFFDLKDYCRRYQLYAKGVVSSNSKSSAERIIVLKIPIFPQGLDVNSLTKDKKVDHYWNKTRDGPLGIILSGYRFFCGSIRFKLAIDVVNRTSSYGPNTVAKIFVQHRPELISGSANVTHRSDTLLGTDDIELPGYATYYQFDNINNVISFEVPYYKPCIKTLLQRPKSSNLVSAEFSSLGEVAVGMTLAGSDSTSFRYDLYYKLGDDARCSNFIGYPPMVDVTRIPPVNVSKVEKDFEFIEAEGGVWDYLPFQKTVNNVTNAADKIAQIDVDKLNETITESSSFLTTLKDNVKNCVPTFDSIKNKVDKYLSTIINLITNFVHCLLNLNIRSIVTAVVSIFTQIKLVSFKCADKLVDSLFNLFKQEHPEAPEELKEVAKGIIEGESDDFVDVSRIIEEDRSYRAAYLSTLIAGVAAMLALGPRICGSDFKSCSMLLFDGVRKFALTANCLFTFIKNNLIVMQKIGNMLVDNSPKIKDIAFLEKEQAEIYAWACEVIDLTDPWKELELFTNMQKASRVYTLSAAGALILLKMSNIKLTMTQSSTLNKLRDSIDSLRNRLAKAHMAPPVRFVPWIYEITGPTGTGKSEMLNDIPYKLLNHLNLKFRSEIIYHRALGNAYWNNCHNQPVCSIDEKFPIAKQGFDDVQIAELFQLKSRCIFNPPMADLPDKNLRYNPLIVQYASNNPFPQLTGILDSTAISRRRDMLIYVQWKAEVRNDKKCPKPLTMDRLPFKWRHNWAALDFYIKTDPMNQFCRDCEGPFTYDELVIKMKKRWEDYYVTEFAKFQSHLQQALSLYPKEDQSFKTFEDHWRETIDIEDTTAKVREFRDQYINLLKSYKAKEISEPIREARVVKLVRSLLGSGEANMTDEKVIEGIKEARIAVKSQNVADLFLLKASKPEKEKIMRAESDDSRSCVSEREKLESIHKTSYNKKNCPHDLLIRFSELERDLFKFNRETKLWRISEFDLENVLREINLNREKKDKLILPEFGLKDSPKPYTTADLVNAEPSTIFNDDDNIYISSNACEHLDCKFKDEYNRQKFYKQYINNSPVMRARLMNGNMSQLFGELPDEYAQKLTVTIDESKKNLQEVKESVGFFQNLYQTLKEKLMTIDWKKWFSKLALVLGVFFFVGSIMKLWGAFVSPSEHVDSLVASSDVQAGMAGVSTCIGGLSLMNASNRVNMSVAEGFPSGDNRAGRTQKKTPVSIAKRQIQLMSPQAQMNDQLASAVQNKIRRNTFFLQMSDPTGAIVYGRAMGICGQYAIVVDHIWESFVEFKSNRTIYDFHFVTAAVPKSSAISVPFDQCKYTRFSDSALGLLKLPIRLGLFEDIRNFILPSARHMYVNGDGMMLELTGDKNGEVINYTHMVKYSLEGKITVKGGKMYSDFESGDTYRYPTFHGKGRCGSVLIALDQTAPIAAIHIAGNGYSGFAESVYREMFSNLENVVSRTSMTFGESMDVNNQKWFVDGQVRGIGIVPPKLAARSLTKSRIVPSEVQETPESPFPVVTDVSVISPKDPRIKDAPFSPMLEGVKHHGKPLMPFNSQDLEIAIEDYQNLILAKCVPQRNGVGILPTMTAINGIEGKDLYDHIEWNSSEGFPFTSFRPGGSHDKRWMFDFDENEYCTGYNKMLEQALEKKWKQRLNNEVPETVFVDCLKDCRIKKEKVLEPGKTRIFSISPVDFTIQQRQCTLDFVTAFMANRLDLEHAIGIDVNSREWTDVAQKLLGTGDAILTGDYSKFGDTIPSEFVHAAFKIIANWYKKYNILTWEHEQQLKIMGYEVANSTHLMFNFLYQVVCGQPSGNSLTVIINSIANSLYIRLAWLHIMRETQYCSLKDLHTLVRWFSYGDDIIAALSNLIKDLFNAKTLCEFFSKYGLKFTNASKGDEIVPYGNLAEAEFLKCGFAPHPIMKHPQLILAPLAVDSCIETVNWINSDYIDKRCMTLQVCEDALRNSFGRGPEFYSNFRQQLIDFWQKKGVHFVADTWTQLNFKVFELDIPINPYIKKLFVKNPPT